MRIFTLIKTIEIIYTHTLFINLQIYDDGSKLILHMIHGFLRTKIVSFVMNLHQIPRPVYFVRHGESDFNERGLIGGGKLC